MKVSPQKIAKVRERMAYDVLNDAEQLHLAKRLMEDVFTRLEAIADCQLSTAEGYLASAVHGCDQAQQLVEGWPHDSLPVDQDLEPENRRE